MADASELKVVTGEVRLSYVHVFEPYSNDPEKDAKFSVLLLIPKTDTATINAIKRAQKAALEAGKAKHFGGKIPVGWKNTLRDGDTERDTEESPEYKGMMFISATANPGYPPGVVDRALNPILDQHEVYSGCYARVSMNAFSFSASGNKGVSFGLRHVQKLRDGEPLGGGFSKPEDDFSSLDDDGDGLL